MIEIELIVGTMGLDKILEDKLPKYSASLLTKAGSTLKAFREGASVFADSNKPKDLPDETYSLSDFDDLMKSIQNDLEFETAAEAMETWPSELLPELMTLIADVKAYLGQQVPQQVVSGSMSGTYLTPSDSDKFRFLWQANLVDDVRRFIDLLNSGAITSVESSLMRTLFPETHDYLIVEVMDKVLDASVEGKVETWEGTWRKQALSGLLGVPVMSFTDVLQYQTGMEEKTAGRPKQQGAVQIAQMDFTSNQAMDTRTVDKTKI